MRMLFVPSSIRKPFGSIDRWIVSAWRESGYLVQILLPGKHFITRFQQAVSAFKPQFLLAMLGNKWSSGDLESIQRSPLPTGIWYTDDPYAIDESLRTCRYFDYVWTNERAAVPFYKKQDCQRVKHLPLGVNTRVFRPFAVPRKYRSEVLILGSAFENRLHEVESLLPNLARRHLRIVGPGWQRLPSYSPIRDRVVLRWVSPREASYYYNGAEVVLNIHRASTDPYLGQNRHQVDAETPNNRVLEIAACRSFQLITHRKGVSDLFNAGELVSYSSIPELKEQIEAALSHPRKRRRLAHLAYGRTFQSHRYHDRVRQMAREIATCL